MIPNSKNGPVSWPVFFKTKTKINLRLFIFPPFFFAY